MHRFALNVLPRRGEEFGGGREGRRRCTLAWTADRPPRPRRGAERGEPRQSPAPLEAGTYTIRLVVNGQTYSQPAVVNADPRGAKPYDERMRMPTTTTTG